MLHSSRQCQEEVDSRLLVVGSQTASLTPSPSFAHNLGCRCPNCQCEAIFDIYVSRPFQWHQEHLNARCFGPCCRALNIRESRRTPNSQLFQVLGFTPTLGQSGVATVFKVHNEVAKTQSSYTYTLQSKNWFWVNNVPQLLKGGIDQWGVNRNSSFLWLEPCRRQQIIELHKTGKVKLFALG